MNGHHTAICKGVRRDGEPCVTPALASGWCFAHDPTLKDARRAGQAKGGHNRSNAVRVKALLPDRLAAVFDQLERAIDEVHEGELSPQQASAMAGLASALVKILTAGELEARVRAIEAMRRERA